MKALYIIIKTNNDQVSRTFACSITVVVRGVVVRRLFLFVVARVGREVDTSLDISLGGVGGFGGGIDGGAVVGVSGFGGAGVGTSGLATALVDGGSNGGVVLVSQGKNCEKTSSIVDSAIVGVVVVVIVGVVVVFVVVVLEDLLVLLVDGVVVVVKDDVASVVVRVASSHSDSASGTHGGFIALNNIPTSQTPVLGTPFLQLM